MKLSRSVGAAIGSTAAFALLLAGCSSSSGGSASGPSAAAKQTLNVWGWSGSPGATTMALIIKAYEKANPNVTVKYNEILNTSYQQKVTLGLQSGTSADVLGIMPGAAANTVSKYLLPVSKYQGVGSLMSNFQASAVAQDKKLWSDGVIRAVPYGSSGTDVGFYNADLLKKAGFAAPPQTWAQWAKFRRCTQSGRSHCRSRRHPVGFLGPERHRADVGRVGTEELLRQRSLQQS